MRMAVWVSRRLIGCTPIGTARQASALRQAPTPATQTPRPAVARACTGCHDGGQGIAMPRSGHCGPGHWPVALTESQRPALRSRSLPTAVWTCCGGRGCSLGCSRRCLSGPTPCHPAVALGIAGWQ
uniref:Uncharacterized protein n=1 Tax=Rousettus aegyptiacus TaxID=9407 RepID=A0A7J8CIK9_ROUAE|nr:hypothetical protein HJG63_009104 [Rousettus aegyptiacus]